VAAERPDRRPGLSGGFVSPLAAVLEHRGRTLTAVPIFERRAPIQLKAEAGKRGAPSKFRAGELVIVEPAGMTRGRRHGGRPVVRDVGRVTRRLGSPDVTADVLEALLIERGCERGFGKPVHRAARAALDRPDEFAREDLTTLATFTMDPAGAKDYDDAISARREDDGRIRAWVHIADVTAYVRPDDPVDQEAYRRGTSVYVPGMVEPMLPEELSNEACSLVPGQVRRAVSVEMLFDGAEVVQASFTRSLIRSDERLTYDQVDEIFAGRDAALEPWGEPLELARAIGRASDERRREREALAVESAEPAFAFDPEGDVVEAHQEQQTESHRVIEHLMIAANEQVARYLEQHKLPTLYRIHERPDPEDIERLVEQLADLGVPTPPIPEHFTSQQAEQFAGSISARVAEHARRVGHGRAGLTSLVLRSLKMAVYSPRNQGHSGLRSACYCHFTSPIRRYPDIVVHRALLSGLGLDDVAPKASDLQIAGEDTSVRERDAQRIERSADDICRAFLLAAQLRGDDGASFEGEVVGLTQSGLFVAFGEGMIYEGFVRARDIRELTGGSGFWGVNEFATALVDEDSGRRIEIGQPLSVMVERIEMARGRVDLLPVKV
jgi:ribonuclease R